MTEPAQRRPASRRKPLHIQIRESIRRKVRAGELVDASGRLMTEAELGAHFGVSRITIRSAIQPLVAEGLFARAPGRGTYLRTNAPERWIGRLMGFSETIRDAGFEPGARILHKGLSNRLDAGVSEALGERAVWELKRLRLADESRIAIEHAYYPVDIGLELDKRDLTGIVMYRVFEEELGLGIGEARQTIGATLADAESSQLLDVAPGTALLSIERTTFSTENRPLELLRAVYLPEYFQLTISLSRRTD